MSEDLARALEAGELSQSQLRELIKIQADQLGLEYEIAVRLARRGELRDRGPIGDDLEFLVELLPVAA